MSKPRRYTIRIKRSAEQEMDRLPAQAFGRAAKAILALEGNPRPPGSRKLRTVHEYRLRVGQYRILYGIDDRDRAIEVCAVGHRRDVYRGI